MVEYRRAVSGLPFARRIGVVPAPMDNYNDICCYISDSDRYILEVGTKLGFAYG